MCLMNGPEMPEKAVMPAVTPPPPPPPPPSATAATMGMDKPSPFLINPKKKNPLRIDKTADAAPGATSAMSGLQIPV